MIQLGGVKKMEREFSFSREAIGTGALSLHMGRVVGLLSHLNQEMLILGRNRRPDANSQQIDLLLGLKTSGQEQKVVQGQPLYLEWQGKEEGASLSLASQKTPLWIKPLILDRNSILLEVGVEREGKEEKGQLILQDMPSEGVGKEAMGETPCFKMLQKGVCWGRDLLIVHYAGGEYAPLKEKQKIFFSDEGLSYVCFVSPGDYLAWEENRWKVKTLDQISASTPLAHIKSAGTKGIEVEAWDERGFYSLHLKFPVQNVQKGNMKGDSLLSSIRLRNTSQVSCVLGKRRMLLKPGDWLLKTSSGWHNLRRFEEIEDCIQHKIKGELFIFDSIEKEQGKTLLKGRLFDEMRMQIQDIVIPVTAEKKKEHSSQKRSPRFQKEAPRGKRDILTPPKLT